jgi:hypothetical protein
MPAYNLLFSHGATNSQPVLFPNIMSVPTLAIDAKILVPGKDKWVRVGWVEAVVMAQAGSATKPVSGQPLRVVEGLHEFHLPTPDLPFQLRFIPRDYITAWSIEVYERIIAPAIEPIGLDANLIFGKLLDLEAKIDAL